MIAEQALVFFALLPERFFYIYSLLMAISVVVLRGINASSCEHVKISVS